jgi:transcriptional regulator with XRE-family HTH domain
MFRHEDVQEGAIMRDQIRLKEWREHHALSQRDLGKRAGLALSTVNDLETGKREPNYKTLRKLADAFHTVPAALHELPATETAEAVKLMVLFEGLDEALGGEGTGAYGAQLVVDWVAAQPPVEKDEDDLFTWDEEMAMRVENVRAFLDGIAAMLEARGVSVTPHEDAVEAFTAGTGTVGRTVPMRAFVQRADGSFVPNPVIARLQKEGIIAAEEAPEPATA